eukprot:1094839-Rhodomonas_salina.1
MEDEAEFNSMTPEQLRACQQDAAFVATRAVISKSPATSKHFSFENSQASSSAGSRSIALSLNRPASAQVDRFARTDSTEASSSRRGSRRARGREEESFLLLQPPTVCAAVSRIPPFAILVIIREDVYPYMSVMLSLIDKSIAAISLRLRLKSMQGGVATAQTEDVQAGAEHPGFQPSRQIQRTEKPEVSCHGAQQFEQLGKSGPLSAMHSYRKTRTPLLNSTQDNWNKEISPPDARIQSSALRHTPGQQQDSEDSNVLAAAGFVHQPVQDRQQTSQSRKGPASAATSQPFSTGDEVECLWKEPSADGKFYHYSASVVRFHSSTSEYTVSCSVYSEPDHNHPGSDPLGACGLQVRWYDPQGFEAETRVPQKSVRRPRSKSAKKRSGSSASAPTWSFKTKRDHSISKCELCGQKVRKNRCKFCYGSGSGVCQDGSTVFQQPSYYPKAKRSRCCCRFCGGTDVVEETKRIATCRNCGFSAECGH